MNLPEPFTECQAQASLTMTYLCRLWRMQTLTRPLCATAASGPAASATLRIMAKKTFARNACQQTKARSCNRRTRNERCVLTTGSDQRRPCSRSLTLLAKPPERMVPALGASAILQVAMAVSCCTSVLCIQAAHSSNLEQETEDPEALKQCGDCTLWLQVKDFWIHCGDRSNYCPFCATRRNSEAAARSRAREVWRCPLTYTRKRWPAILPVNACPQPNLYHLWCLLFICRQAAALTANGNQRCPRTCVRLLAEPMQPVRTLRAPACSATPCTESLCTCPKAVLRADCRRAAREQKVHRLQHFQAPGRVLPESL